MPKTQRPLSPYAADAVALLGQLIRKARIERKLKAVETNREIMVLLPKSVRNSRIEADDDF